MKKTFSVLFSALTIGMMLVSCGGGSTGKSNKSLGKVISLMQEEQQRKEDLEAKAKECKDAECFGKLVDKDTKAKAAYEENIKKEI
ncbi:MAG: hypothetical protein IJ748_05585, partial [Bacteroidales bacterium]|nr:hypothetical protein [Bacteroidales bacterium]